MFCFEVYCNHWLQVEDTNLTIVKLRLDIFSSKQSGNERQKNEDDDK